MIDLDLIEATLAKSPRTLDSDIIERLVEELRALRAVAKTASSVSSEPEVRELLLCFTQGHAMLEALAALEHPNYAP